VNRFSIRRLQVGDDVGAAADLLIRFFREEGFDTPDDVIRSHTARMAGIEACGLFLCEADGAAIGVTTISMEFGIEFGWSGEMGDLYVLPDWRGKGVSQALVAAVENFLKERGATGYQVTVTPFAEEAHGLQGYYRKLGFGSEGRLILYKRL
jgi:GNAT superfamily N-acetyltransferase